MVLLLIRVLMSVDAEDKDSVVRTPLPTLLPPVQISLRLL